MQPSRPQAIHFLLVSLICGFVSGFGTFHSLDTIFDVYLSVKLTSKQLLTYHDATTAELYSADNGFRSLLMFPFLQNKRVHSYSTVTNHSRVFKEED